MMMLGASGTETNLDADLLVYTLLLLFDLLLKFLE